MNGDASRSIRDAVDDAASRRVRRETARRWGWFAAVAVVTFAADQAAKVSVRSSLLPGERVDVLPGLDIVRGRNEGIAFGLFPGNPGLVATLTVVALVVIAVALARLARRSMIAAVGGGLLIGGSVGNLADRVAHGGVTDFLDLGSWPAFNIADMAIIAGAALVALGVIRERPAADE